MGTSDTDPLVDSYQNRIGAPSTGDEAYGYWVFVIRVLAGFIGIALVMLSQEPGELVRGVGIAVAAIGLVLLLIGPIIRLPLKRGATTLSYLGGVVALVGVGWFFIAFQAGNWSANFSSNEVLIIGVYGLGVFGIVLGSIFVPLLTSPREEQMAAEDRAATAEAERDAAIGEAKQRAREAEADAERAREEAERATIGRTRPDRSQPLAVRVVHRPRRETPLVTPPPEQQYYRRQCTGLREPRRCRRVDQQRQAERTERRRNCH